MSQREIAGFLEGIFAKAFHDDDATLVKASALAIELLEAGQGDLFATWKRHPGASTDASAQAETEFLKAIKRFCIQALALNSRYPGGLTSYVANAERLLTASARGDNAFAGLEPSVPDVVSAYPAWTFLHTQPSSWPHRLGVGSRSFDDLEASGLVEASHCAFVLVAGGMGERLGYGGAKPTLPSDTVSMKSFLDLYISSILSFQGRRSSAASGREGSKNLRLPLAIMVSANTEDPIRSTLKANNNFGMAEGQITLLRQEAVACLDALPARLAADPDDMFRLLEKPHGHGDIHALLHDSGTVERWRKESGGALRWILFFQDTNGMCFRTLPAVLGAASAQGWASAFICGRRRAGDAMGAIARMSESKSRAEAAGGAAGAKAAAGAGSTRVITCNVEYNLLDSMLRGAASGKFPDGDANGPDGFSPFPGNTNQLLYGMDAYLRALRASRGLVPEFVNPKYKEGSGRTEFKKPTRLECMMQDFSKLLVGDDADRVGCVQFCDPGEGDGAVAIDYVNVAAKLMSSAYNPSPGDGARTGTAKAERRIGTVEQQMSAEKEAVPASGWKPSASLCLYNPLKNNPVDAAKKAANGMSPSSPAAAEMELFATNCKLLLSLGVHVGRPVVKVLDGVHLLVWPRIVWTPRFATTLAQLRERFPNPSAVSISSRSMLLLDCPGPMLVVESLELDGGLWVVAAGQEQSLGEGHTDAEPCRIRVGGEKADGVVEGRISGEDCELITAQRGARCAHGAAATTGAEENSSIAAVPRRRVTRVELSAGAKIRAAVTVGAQDYANDVDDEVFRIRGYRLF